MPKFSSNYRFCAFALIFAFCAPISSPALGDEIECHEILTAFYQFKISDFDLPRDEFMEQCKSLENRAERTFFEASIFEQMALNSGVFGALVGVSPVTSDIRETFAAILPGLNHSIEKNASPSTQLLRASINFRLDKPREAISDFNHARNNISSVGLEKSIPAWLGDDFGSVLHATAWDLLMNGELELAIESSSYAIYLFQPTDYSQLLSGAYARRGWLRSLDDPQSEGALVDFNEALLRSPDYWFALLHRGRHNRNLGNYSAALTDFDTLIELANIDKKALGLAHRGLTYYQMGNLVDAARDLSDSLKIDKTEIAENGLIDVKEALAAQNTTSIPIPPPDQNTKGIALVIGNGQYQTTGDELSNAEDDARDVARALSTRGYQIYRGGPHLNLTLNEFDRVIEGFQKASSGFGNAVVWYAGHGQQFPDPEGLSRNWLIPVDAEIGSAKELQDRAIKVSSLLNAVAPATGLRLVIIDACRDASFKTRTTRGRSRGFGRVQRDDTVIVYSTETGRKADDGDPDDRNSPFARAFLEQLNEYDDEYITQFFAKVAGRTAELTDGRQDPEIIFKDRTGAHLSL